MNLFLNTLDITIGIVLFAAVILGFRRGFISQLVSILSLVLAYIVAYKFYDDLAPWLAKMIPLKTFAAYPKYEFIISTLHLDRYIMNALSFALLFFTVRIALSLIGSMLNLVAKVPGLNTLNRLGGVLLCFLEAGLLLLVVIHLLTIIPSDWVQGQLAKSQTAPWFIKAAPILGLKLQELWKDVF